MLITHHGHSEFLLETADGFRILTDPYNAEVGYPMHTVICDAVTVSHGHGDHCEVSKVQGGARVFDQVGFAQLPDGVAITGIPSFHDDCQGAQRGKNIIFLIEAEGLRIAHLGDLGDWDESLAEKLTDIDILLLPVGGYFTMPPARAASLSKRIAPRILIPMHYRTQVNAAWPIAPLSVFMQEMGREAPAPFPLLRVTCADLSEQPSLIILSDSTES